MPEKPSAVILLSGGLDSTTVLAIATSEGYACNCLSFDYGQKQTVELAKAAKIAAIYGVERHLILRLDLDRIGGSALTADIAVPKNGNPDRQGTIPITYVPARNAILLAHAVAWAEVLGAWDIFIGVNAVDYSGYPDCRPEFLAAFAHMANLGTRAGISGAARFSIKAPLMHLSKAEIITKGISLGVDYSLTHSCYDPQGTKACGHCDACILRRNGFVAAGVADPTDYL
ncbi:7-cyano-7-deazaguanine synthase QueC [Desulfoprunum benzoelyticum]|uniref:7-cyano-7-deazaguanine synthase n=1 Tax=Desulfoprunum benzoelyticum TaxID=1506996 RepID=A0A840UZ08_9BACT|nr:7-cyano-7-deazaguanine synthase QueC [Desulfoprunum benzoelyticum]MBB5347888.1 7-cyano-7-deazaguanine synthase [Desulfoprunum benzoelyticum]MBM9530355.1 7-cyano-7-deazaguanine synthase QueC [Desulfoprunum benzoelyticum]